MNRQAYDCAWILTVVAVPLLLSLFCSVARSEIVRGSHFSDPDTAVQEGRDALDQWWGYPWYERTTDDVRPIEVKPPPPPKPTTTGTSMNWDFGANFLQWFAWAALAIILGLLAYFLIKAFLEDETAAAQHIARSGEHVTDPDRLESLPFQVKRPRANLLEEARRHYQEGNFAEAIIYFFSYQLVELDKSQLIHLARGKTNRQYLREVRSSSKLGDLIEQTMVAFEDVFFGDHPLSRPRFEACWSRLGEFEQQIAQGTT